jgi:hypothetical protein
MTVSIVKQSNDSITLQITIPFNRSMLDSENTIQQALNEAGQISTHAVVKGDTRSEEGSVLIVRKTPCSVYPKRLSIRSI